MLPQFGKHLRHENSPLRLEMDAMLGTQIK
jgi:hypothetical protein